MTNPLFNQTTDATEQRLIASLIEEAISIHGVPCQYLPKKYYNIDGVLQEDAQAYFDTTYEFDAYVKNYDSFTGQGDFLSQIGVELRDRIELTVGRQSFGEGVSIPAAIQRPREGDLIYFTPNGRLFEIREVKRFADYYPLGTLPTFDITAELVEATSFNLNTGVAEIDGFEQATTEDVLEFVVRTAAGAPIRLPNGDYWVVDNRDESAVDPLDTAKTLHSEDLANEDRSEADIFDGGDWNV